MSILLYITKRKEGMCNHKAAMYACGTRRIYSTNNSVAVGGPVPLCVGTSWATNFLLCSKWIVANLLPVPNLSKLKAWIIWTRLTIVDSLHQQLRSVVGNVWLISQCLSWWSYSTVLGLRSKVPTTTWSGFNYYAHFFVLCNADEEWPTDVMHSFHTLIQVLSQ